MRLSRKLSGAVAAATIAIMATFVPWYEGTELQSYQDSAGVWTICTGHTATATPDMTVTKKQCDALLTSDLGQAYAAVDDLVEVPIPILTRAALGSFVFNVGRSAFSDSTLLRKLNAGDIVGACNQLPRWVYAGGKRLRGLVKRRADERELCLAGIGQ